MSFSIIPRTNVLFIGAFALASASLSLADPVAAPLFTNHAVLQQDRPVPIWGTAEPGEKINVQYAGQDASTTTDPDGKWMLHLAPLSPGAAGPLTISGQKTIVLEDVIVGEVWLCSGQSNMAFTVKRGKNAAEEIAAAAHPEIRVFTTKPNFQKTPQTICEGEWVVCSPETAAKFSAAAYFFGRELAQALDRPIGLIVSAVGGTKIELWTSREGHEKLGQVAQLEAEAARALKKQAEPPPADPKQAERQRSSNKKAEFAIGGLYNGMIAPLIPYAIRGAIWYQGESNSNQLKTRYEEYITTLVWDWRTNWGEDFPFAWVQLPEFLSPQIEPVEDGGWTLLREAMLKARKTPKTGMAITLGLGEAKDIHPKNKQGVGKRLAWWALGDVYQHKVPATSGPLPESHQITGNEIEVTFSHADGGLILKGGSPNGFAIAGEDQKWVWAEVKIEGDCIVAWNSSVPKPVALRYAWADHPIFTLFNAAGLPASPFRTDQFPQKQKPDRAPKN